MIRCYSKCFLFWSSCPLFKINEGGQFATWVIHSAENNSTVEFHHFPNDRTLPGNNGKQNFRSKTSCFFIATPPPKEISHQAAKNIRWKRCLWQNNFNISAQQLGMWLGSNTGRIARKVSNHKWKLQLALQSGGEDRLRLHVIMAAPSPAQQHNFSKLNLFSNEGLVGELLIEFRLGTGKWNWGTIPNQRPLEFWWSGLWVAGHKLINRQPIRQKTAVISSGVSLMNLNVKTVTKKEKSTHYLHHSTIASAFSRDRTAMMKSTRLCRLMLQSEFCLTFPHSKFLYIFLNSNFPSKPVSWDGNQSGEGPKHWTPYCFRVQRVSMPIPLLLNTSLWISFLLRWKQDVLCGSCSDTSVKNSCCRHSIDNLFSMSTAKKKVDSFSSTTVRHSLNASSMLHDTSRALCWTVTFETWFVPIWSHLSNQLSLYSLRQWIKGCCCSKCYVSCLRTRTRAQRHPRNETHPLQNDLPHGNIWTLRGGGCVGVVVFSIRDKKTAVEITGCLQVE